MPASIDIEYPHAGDTVGLMFPVGGNYDARDLLKGKDENPSKFGVNDKIVCKVFKADGATQIGMDFTKLFTMLDPAVGIWSVPAMLPPPAQPNDYADCVIKAILQVGPMTATPYPSNQIEDVDATSAGNGPPPPVGMPGPPPIMIVRLP